MGSRVTRNQLKRGRTFLRNRTDFYPLKLFKHLQFFLTTIGTPFYYLLTWIIVFVFKAIWFLGQLTIEWVAGGFSFIDNLLSWTYKAKKSLPKPKLKKPQVNIRVKTP